MKPTIHLTDLTLGYRGQAAVREVNGSFEAGSLTAIVGPNGAGKSTLLKGVIGEVKPLHGQIRLDGVKPRDIAWLPQVAEIDRSFPMNVLDLAALGAVGRRGMMGRIRGRDLEAAHEAIERVGLSGFQQRPVGSLSGGQLQRALFARVLVQDAPVILLDEPFAAVDTRTTADLLEIVARWRVEGRLVVAVLHDYEIVRRHFPRTLLLARASVAWGDTAEVMTEARLMEARDMCEAFHEEERDHHHTHAA